MCFASHSRFSIVQQRIISEMAVASVIIAIFALLKRELSLANWQATKIL